MGGIDRNTRLLRRRAAYREVFTGEHGDVVFADLFDFCGARKPSFVPGSADETAFNEGKRRVMLRILGILEMDEETISRVVRIEERNLNG